jgi:hypothetical protein
VRAAVAAEHGCRRRRCGQQRQGSARRRRATQATPIEQAVEMISGEKNDRNADGDAADRNSDAGCARPALPRTTWCRGLRPRPRCAA